METQERKSWGWYIKHKRHKAGGSTKALEQEKRRGGEEDFEYKTPDAQKQVGHKTSEA